MRTGLQGEKAVTGYRWLSEKEGWGLPPHGQPHSEWRGSNVSDDISTKGVGCPNPRAADSPAVGQPLWLMGVHHALSLHPPNCKDMRRTRGQSPHLPLP